MKFKAVHILLLVSSFVMAVLSFSVLTGNTIYADFVHLLRQSPSSSEGTAALATAAQSQQSNNSNPQSPPSKSIT